MRASILGLGTALPPHSMKQADVLEMSSGILCQNERQQRLLRVLFRKSAVETRRTVMPFREALRWCPSDSVDQYSIGEVFESLDGNGDLPATRTTPVLYGPSTRERMQMYSDFAPPLAVEAANNAFASAGLESSRITHLVTVSCTGFDAPGCDIALIKKLGLPLTTQRIHVGYMGCHGAINGLRAARAIVASEPQAKVLLCAVELCSLHYRFNWDDEGVIGNALFADGAAAVVVGHSDDSQVPVSRHLAATGSSVLPDSEHVMSWRVGDHGFEMRLTGEVGDKIRTYLRPWMTQWLGENGLALEDIATWAVHPGGPKILSAVEESLELGPEATAISREVLAAFGNMSSPTVLFILDRCQRQNGPEANSGPCVMLGFGPGLVAEAMLLK